MKVLFLDYMHFLLQKVPPRLWVFLRVYSCLNMSFMTRVDVPQFIYLKNPARFSNQKTIFVNHGSWAIRACCQSIILPIPNHRVVAKKQQRIWGLLSSELWCFCQEKKNDLILHQWPQCGLGNVLQLPFNICDPCILWTSPSSLTKLLHWVPPQSIFFPNKFSNKETFQNENQPTCWSPTDAVKTKLE